MHQIRFPLGGGGAEPRPYAPPVTNSWPRHRVQAIALCFVDIKDCDSAVITKLSLAVLKPGGKLLARVRRYCRHFHTMEQIVDNNTSTSNLG